MLTTSNTLPRNSWIMVRRREVSVRRSRLCRSSCAAALMSVLSFTAMAGEPRDENQPGERQQIAISQSVVPLPGPWRFHAGDSPGDRVAGIPLWAEPDFDDSGWETLSPAPTGASRATRAEESALVPGFTAKDHEKRWGFCWYRIRLNLGTFAEKLALAGPEQVDAYQVFVNGRLLGGFGDFSSKRPATYYKQPMIFPFTSGGFNSVSTPAVIALRVWTEENPLVSSHPAGGVRSAPLIGEENAVTVRHQQRWQDVIRSYLTFVIEALIYALLAIVAFSLILFDRSDRAYFWMGIVFVFTSAYSALDAFDVWTQHLSILQDLLLVRCLLGPLAYVGWFMVWWAWFRRRRPRWMPFAAAGVTAVYVVSYAVALNLFFSPVRPAIGLTLEVVSLIARLLFFVLLGSIVIHGIRRYGLEGWLVVPVILLLGIAPFQTELRLLGLAPSWDIFGTQNDLPQIASLMLAVIVALLLLRRLLLSVRRQRLIELDAMRAQLQSDFVAAVSHEFRTPLTALKSITDLLVHDRIADEPRRREGYLYLDRETTRLQRLVEDLLDFGRMEAGHKQYRFSTFDVFRLVRDAVSDLSEEADAEGFDIETSFVTAQASIHADEEAVHRAVRNLIENAMKYSPQCRTVWVDGKVDHHHVSISIRDQGMGIDASEQRAIFQKFVRGDAAKKAGIKGTGIGLTMVKQISEAMGGEIRLQSQVDVGSTFTILLPLAQK